MAEPGEEDKIQKIATTMDEEAGIARDKVMVKLARPMIKASKDELSNSLQRSGVQKAQINPEDAHCQKTPKDSVCSGWYQIPAITNETAVKVS